MTSHPPDGRTAEPSTDELYRLLASESRRDVLSILAETTDGSATVETLADRIAQAGSDDLAQADPDDVPEADPDDLAQADSGDPEASAAGDRSRETVRIRLFHVHLPKLDAADLVEYDPDSGTVEYAGDETAEALLDATE